MEFFYQIGSYDMTEILGSHLYYTQEEFDKIICTIYDEYDERQTYLDNSEWNMWKINNEIFGIQDYLVYKLKEDYGLVELDISAKER